MDNAYRVLVYQCKKDMEEADASRRVSTKEKIEEEKKYIYHAILELLTDDEIYLDLDVYDRTLQLISYIKVISRDYLARNYIIRGVIIDIMKIMLGLLASPEKSVDALQNILGTAGYLQQIKNDQWYQNNDIEKMFHKLFRLLRNDVPEYKKDDFSINGDSRIESDPRSRIAPALQYRVFKVLVHRLALLGSSFVLKTDVTESFLGSNQNSSFIDSKLEKSKNANDTDIFLLFNEKLLNRAVFDYCCSIKAATMAEKNVYLSFKLFDFEKKLNRILFENFKNARERNKTVNPLLPRKQTSEQGVQTILDYFNLENTMMLHDLMEELYQTYLIEEGKGDIQGFELLYCGDGGLQARQNLFDKVIFFVRKKVTSVHRGEEWLRQNYLSKYLMYYDRLFICDKTISDRSLGKSVEEMEKAELRDDQIEMSFPELSSTTTCSVDSKEYYHKIATMFNYYKTLRDLTNHSFDEKQKNENLHEKLPYIYEDLCLSIAQMTGYQSCYIIYHETGEDCELVTRSGYYYAEGDFDDDLSSINITLKSMDEIRLFTDRNLAASEKSEEACPIDLADMQLNTEWELDSSREVAPISDSILFILRSKKDQTKKHEFLVVKLDYAQSFPVATETTNRSFYIILEKNAITESEEQQKAEIEEQQAKPNEWQKKVLSILFMRNRLLCALWSDYSALINYRFDCGYIQPLEKKQEKINILHISDLHINDKKYYEKLYMQLTMKCFQEFREADEGNRRTMDLIAVTGDLIDCADNAFEAQCRYQIVQKVLATIAIQLWGQNEGNGFRLPHDWKRRILVVPGNHDYTAMNDVSIELDTKEDTRRIKAGFPAHRSGGTMSKLTYYIEFMMKFLDAPIDELIANDMNEVRYYKNLMINAKQEQTKKANGIGVCLLNSVSKSNAKQTNKVAFDCELIENLLNKHKEELGNAGRIVLLSHHALDYFPDYFEDKYMLWPDKLRELTTLFYSTYYAFEALICFNVNDKVQKIYSNRKNNLKLETDLSEDLKDFISDSGEIDIPCFIEELTKGSFPEISRNDLNALSSENEHLKKQRISFYDTLHFSFFEMKEQELFKSFYSLFAFLNVKIEKPELSKVAGNIRNSLIYIQF